MADEIDRLRELKQKTLEAGTERLVRRLIEKITVYEERFEVEFKSGMKVDVER